MVRAIKVVPLAEDAYGGPAGRSFGAGSGSARRSSAGMGKVPSLVFDLDLGEGTQHPQASDGGAEEAGAAEVAQKLRALLEPWSEPGGCCTFQRAPVCSVCMVCFKCFAWVVVS